MKIEKVDAPGVEMTAWFKLAHLCPFKDEVDRGEVKIEWVTGEGTIELHSLAEWLGSWATVRVSHEQLTRGIVDSLSALDGITVTRVTSHWVTGGGDVSCSAVPRERVVGEGA